MHVDETIIITVEDKRTETMRIRCKNIATSGGNKHKNLVLNCITVLIRVQKLIFEQYPSRHGSKDDNKLVEDSNNFIVRLDGYCSNISFYTRMNTVMQSIQGSCVCCHHSWHYFLHGILMISVCLSFTVIIIVSSTCMWVSYFPFTN